MKLLMALEYIEKVVKNVADDMALDNDENIPYLLEDLYDLYSYIHNLRSEEEEKLFDY